MYGAVTTGDMWRFLRLDGDALAIDTEQYTLARAEQVLGILMAIVTPA